jgi:hypothetical protein
MAPSVSTLKKGDQIEPKSKLPEHQSKEQDMAGTCRLQM